MNLLGDIGGLSGVILPSGQLIVLYLTSKMMDKFFVTSIFTGSKLNFSSRTGLCCLKSNREKKLTKKGMQKVNDEVDLIHFIKNQLKIRGLLKVLATKEKRSQVKNSRLSLVSDSDPEEKKDKDRN
jgi:hypothetical protein